MNRDGSEIKGRTLLIEQASRDTTAWSWLDDKPGRAWGGKVPLGDPVETEGITHLPRWITTSIIVALALGLWLILGLFAWGII